MEIEQLLAIGRFGMTYERLRMETAARNVAMANSAHPADAPVSPMRVTALADADGADFARMLADGDLTALRTGQPALRLEPSSTAPREIHDPSHPLADAGGTVRYPDVDLAQEMSTMMSASRGYEANVRAMNMLRSMLLKALELGGRR